MKKCGKCKTILADDAAFCTNCGAKFVAAPSSEPAPAAPHPTRPASHSAAPSGTPRPTRPAPASRPTTSPAPAPKPQPRPVSVTLLDEDLVDEMSAPLRPVTSAEPVTPSPDLSSNAASSVASTNFSAAEPATSPSPAVTPSASATPKKSNPILLAVIMTVIAIAVGVGFFFLGKAEGKKEASSTNTSSGTTTSSSSSTTPTATTTSADAGVTVGSLSFSVPDSFQYEITVSDGYQVLMLTDDPDTWVAQIYYLDDVPFANVSANFEEVAGQFSGSGQANVNGTEFYYLDDNTAEYLVRHYFSKFGTGTIETAVAYRYGAEASVIEKLEPIISSAKKSDTSRSISDETAEPSPLTTTVKNAKRTTFPEASEAPAEETPEEPGE